MALPKFEKDISYISKLADQPNDTVGNPLSAAQLKDRFDAAGNDIKEYINTVLIPFLQGASAAANLGLEPISGITDATDLQSALEALKRAIDNTATGELPDASLTGSKLVPEAITNRELAPAAVQGRNVAPKTLTGANAVDKSFGADVFEDEFLQHRHIGKYVIEDENIADNTIDASGKIKDGTMTAKKYAPLSVPTIAYQEKSVTAPKLAEDAVRIRATNVVVDPAAFAADNTYPDFPFKGDIVNASSTDSMRPEIVFSVADATSGVFCPVAETYNGGVYIYASEVPAAAITIPVIELWR